MKQAVFDEQTSKALKKWHMQVKRKQEDNTEKSPTTQTLGGSSKSLKNSLKRYSPGPTLHRFMTTGHSTRSPPYVELHEYCEGDEESSQANLMGRVDDNHRNNEMIVLPKEADESGSSKPNPV